MDKGKKMAVLVGCNYPSTPHELRGCYNDVLAMRETLVARFGFSPDNVEVLIDKPGSPVMPTGANIKKLLNKMVDQAEKGDILFFHYSGHGTLVKSQHLFGKEEEAIVPCDFNLIASPDFRQIVNRIPKGATFTILSDSCHSGGLIDKESEQIGPSTMPESDTTLITSPYKPKHITLQSILQHLITPTTTTLQIDTNSLGPQFLALFGPDSSIMFRERVESRLRPDEGILLSGCQTNETSADVEMMNKENEVRACGAFSNAVQMALKEKPGQVTNRELVMMARRILSLQHFVGQHPCLYCSDENADAVFLSPLV